MFYYKIILSNSNDWINNELLDEIGVMMNIWSDSYVQYEKTGINTFSHKSNYGMVYNFGYMIDEEEIFRQRFRLVEFIKTNKINIHFHYSLEQKPILEKMIDLSNKTYKERLIDFYLLYNQLKINDVEPILLRYSNNIELLFCRLKKQYSSKLEIF